MSYFKKTIFFFTIIVLNCFTAKGQSYHITGVVKDTAQVIAFANVILTNNNGEMITGAITEEDGSFNLMSKQGTYTVHTSFLGYKTRIKKIDVSGNINLGVILLESQDNELDEVVIEARKAIIEQKIDRLVFNVENSIASIGGNAIEALKVAPRIRVQNDEIKMIGKSNMGVMINGRLQKLSGEDLINFLKNIPTNDIKSVEIISNPPSKYSAEGNSGLINIITKRGRENSWNASVRSTYRQATHARGSIGGSFNMQKNKFQLNSAISYINGSTAPQETEKIYYPNFTWNGVNDTRNFSNFTSLRLGIEYKLNTKSLIGFNYNFLNSNPLMKEINKTKLFRLSDNKLDSIITTLGRRKYQKEQNSLNCYFTYDLDTIGKKLSVDFDFFDYDKKTNRSFDTRTYLANNKLRSNSIEKARNYGVQYIKNYAVNIDMEHPTSEVDFNYGVRVVFTETDNLFNYFNIVNEKDILNSNYSNKFNYKESTQAPYINVQKKILKKWEIKGGIRYEFTQTKGVSKTLNQTNTNNYSKLFPTIYLSYIPNSANSLSINYGKRVKRPIFNFLNPFRIVNNSYSYVEGNPALQPAFIDNIELTYAYKDKLATRVYYSYTDDNFEQVIILDKMTNSQQVKPLNFIVNKIFGVNQSFMFKPMQWWNMNTSIDVYHSSTNSKIPVTLQYLKGWKAEFNMSSDIIFNKKRTFFFNTNLWFMTKGVDALDYNSTDFQLDASIKCLLLDKKLALSLSFQDIIDPRGTEYRSFSRGIENSFKNYYDEQYLKLGIVFSFGKKDEIRNRQKMNQKENSRI